MSKFSIERLKAENVEEARALFERYPFKQSQRRAQGLDAARLNEFYFHNLKRGVEAGTPHWIARGEDGEPVAMASLAPDAWHSEIYGLRMGKIATWMNGVAPGAGGPLLEAVVAAAREAGVEHLSARLDGEDYPSLHGFERAGFSLIDVSVKLTRPMETVESARRSFDPERDFYRPDRWAVRRFKEGDSEWMMALGGRAHTQNHFLNDPALPREKTERLFSEWVRKCIEKLAWRIYVLADPEGQGRGFVIYLRNRGFADAVGRRPVILDYVVLDPEVRGGGLGAHLIAMSLKDMAANPEVGEPFDYCELRTSQHNHAALAAYEKLGFRICATDFIVHRLMRRG